MMRKTNTQTVLALALIGLASAGTMWAESDPFAGPNRNLDAREEAQRTEIRTPSALEPDRFGSFRNQIPGLRYQIDAATGATRTLSSAGGFLTQPSSTDALTTATSFLESNRSLLGLSAADVGEYAVSNVVPSRVSGATHVYLQQKHAGLLVYNGLYQVNTNREGRISGLYNSFMPNLGASLNTLQPRLTAGEAVSWAARHLGIKTPEIPKTLKGGKTVEQLTAIDPSGISDEPITARLMILPIKRGESRLVWNFQIYTLDHQHWFDMNVDAVTGKIWTRFDWVATDQYRVYEIPAESPNHVQGGPLPPADGRTLVTDPADPTASPSTWHSGNLTEGNNVRAYEDSNNTNSGTPVNCGGSQICDFALDLNQAPSTYRPAAVANLFYWNNIIHDVLYQYGFDEASGNFQENNFGNGGAGSDSVNAEAQDGGGTNNANFATPSDGSNPRMQMYIWTAPNPDIDGDFDNGIVIHEYGHGISNRLVGGPNNVSCLGNSQQAGEGWSDWYALALTGEVGDAGTDRRGIGTYALNEPTTGTGIRNQPYSTDQAINNWTYESIRSAAVPHGVGAVWAQALWEVYWALVDVHGYDPDIYNATGGSGNQRALLYVTEGLKNTACSPTFLDARDGVLQAVLNNNPADECIVWQAFADFGLGVNATTTGSNSSATNGFDIPAQCQCSPQPIADAGPDQTICLGTSTTVGTPAQPSNTYSWSPGGQTTAEISVSPSVDTTYTVTATTTCGSANDAATVTVDDGTGGGLSEDFEGGLGNWTAGGLWHLATSSACAPPGYSSPFNALYYGQDSTCNYSTGGSNSGNLISPPITGIDGSSTLTFDYYRQVESYASGTYDWTRVDVSGDGGSTWTNVWARNSTNASASTWTSSGAISLAAWAGSTIQVRFNFDTIDGSFNTFDGWLIDDVVVTGQSSCTGGGNTAPVADSQSTTVAEDSSVSILLTATDAEGDPLTYSVTAGPSNGSLSGAAPNLTYSPSTDFNGSDSFTFVANDGVVNSNTATVSITVTPVADAPVADDQSVTTPEDTALAIILTASDADGDALTYTIGSGPSNGSLSGVAPNLTYTPSADFNGSDSFTFSANDGGLGSNVATVSITVTPVNDAPVANDDSATTTEDAAVAITLTASDVEGDTLSYSVSTAPANGTLSGTAPNLTYTPSANFNGSDSFTFFASDGSASSNTATVSITVTAVNDAPVADNDSVITNEDVAVGISLSASDADGDPLTYSLGSPTNGSLSGAAPNLTYTPNANFNGSDSFTFSVNDGQSSSNTATVSITVNSVNDAPVADAKSVSTDEDTAVAVTLTGSDIDGDSLTFAVATGPANGSLSGTSPSLTYTPNADFNGSDSFTYIANDGTVNSGPATVSITVNPVNDVPVANAQSVTTQEDTPKAITLTGSDVDGDPLTYFLVAPPTNGLMSGSEPNVTYTPNTGFTGSDSFTFRVNDGTADSNTATVSITVSNVNNAPVADDQSVSVAEDGSVGITLTASDSDGDPLTYTVASVPANGNLSGTAPTLTYTPNANFNGSDSFTFVVNDGSLGSNTATVSITVTPVNDAPVADGQSVSVDQDSSVSITLTGSDIDGDALGFVIVTNPSNGGLTGTPPNVTYTPNPGYTGSDDFTFSANDGTINSTPATVSITVDPTATPITVTFTSIGAHDGWVRESSENSNVGGARSATGRGRWPIRPGDESGDRQYKGILSFDTSSIPAGATVTSVTLETTRGRVQGSNPFSLGMDPLLVDVVSGAFGGSVTLDASDFQAAATATAVASMSNPTSDGQVSSGSFNAAGLAAINTGGTTQVRLYFSLDDNDDGNRDALGFYSGDNSTSSRHPRLVVTYTP